MHFLETMASRARIPTSSLLGFNAHTAALTLAATLIGGIFLLGG
jgi:hypothetical protein